MPVNSDGSIDLNIPSVLAHRLRVPAEANEMTVEEYALRLLILDVDADVDAESLAHPEEEPTPRRVDSLCG